MGIRDGGKTAGSSDQNFKAKLNFYNVHYAYTHMAGASGGNNDDMRESLDLMAKGIVNTTAIATYIGGLDSVIDTVLNLPKIPGGKKLIYTEIALPLIAIEDFASKGKEDPIFDELAKIVGKTNHLWSPEVEKYLLAHAKSIVVK